MCVPFTRNQFSINWHLWKYRSFKQLIISVAKENSRIFSVCYPAQSLMTQYGSMCGTVEYCSFHFDYEKEIFLYSPRIGPMSKSCPLQRRRRELKPLPPLSTLASPLLPPLSSQSSILRSTPLSPGQGLQRQWPGPGSGGHWWYDQDQGGHAYMVMCYVQKDMNNRNWLYGQRHDQEDMDISKRQDSNQDQDRRTMMTKIPRTMTKVRRMWMWPRSEGQ